MINETNSTATSDAARAMVERRIAELNAQTTIWPDRPARRLAPKARRHSVPHRSIR